MTNKPIITLTNLDHCASLSEETPAYTATINVDGKPFCRVSNHGHGGCDDYYPLKSDRATQAQLYEAIKTLNAKIAETYPKETYDWGVVEESLEGLCWDLVERAHARRNFQSLRSRKVVFVVDGKCYTVSGKRDQRGIDFVKRKHPTAVVLNDLPVDEAFDVYYEATGGN